MPEGFRGRGREEGVGGGSWRDILGGPGQPPRSPTSQFGNPATFTAAADTQASDYDRIMKGYENILKGTSESPISSPNVTPQNVSAPGAISPERVDPRISQYSQSPDVTKSLAGLSDLATTGGYSAEGIADLRARGISPTRSIYANAQQNVERQRALGGGYSPNFGAVQAQMAREESEQIGERNTAINAGIAQNVASNRLAAASPYAAASGAANAARTESDRANAETINRAAEANAERGLQAQEFNVGSTSRINEANANRAFEASTGNVNRALQSRLANRGNQLGAVQGMQSLYGTTPALTNLFGNQVIQAGQLGQRQQEIGQQRQRDMYGFINRAAGE